METTKKPINKHKKGVKVELIAKKYLASLGFLVETKNYSRFQSKDFYNLFDLIAIKGKILRLIQVKSNPNHVKKAVEDIRIWKKENNVGFTCEVWCYQGMMNKVPIWAIEEIS